jgi:Reverse transcriptase (RNA-dependent DNA polymerase)
LCFSCFCPPPAERTLAALRALHPDTDRPAVRAPLEDIPPAPTITMTAHAVHRRRWRCRQGREGFPGFYASLCERDLTPCVARCFGTAKHVSILKNAARGVAGGLRPRAVGTVLRRLASILVLHKALTLAADNLLPNQVSIVAAAGTDILVHGFREKLEQFGHDPEKVALRVDAANAFNAVSRAEILERVCEHAPPVARFVHAIYGGQPYVVTGRTLLLSRQGTQQGDPLGMLLFALAIQHLILCAQSECDLELNLWYADEGTLVGSIAEVAKAYQILKDDGPKYCFSLVPHKTSLWWRTTGCVRL